MPATSATGDGAARLSAVPVVDLSAGDAAAIGELRRACREVGFFYVAGHGIPDTVVDGAFAASRQLFSLPPNAKRDLAATAESPRGYTAMGAETLDPATSKRGDTKEGFYVGRELAADEPENAIERRGGNKWPVESDAPGFRGAVEAYFAALHGLTLRLLALVAAALDLPSNTFEPFFQRPMETLRLLHYAAEKSAADGSVLACGAHTDYGALTLLKTDDVPGLEVRLGRSESSDAAEDSGWVPVPPLPGAFIVNFGDALQRWTNDAVRSTLHRVVNREGRERYSIPFFVDPAFDAPIACLPQLLAAGEEPRYPPTTMGEYLLGRYAATYQRDGPAVAAEPSADSRASAAVEPR